MTLNVNADAAFEQFRFESHILACVATKQFIQCYVQLRYKQLETIHPTPNFAQFSAQFFIPPVASFAVATF